MTAKRRKEVADLYDFSDAMNAVMRSDGHPGVSLSKCAEYRKAGYSDPQEAAAAALWFDY